MAFKAMFWAFIEGVFSHISPKSNQGTTKQSP